MHRQTHQKIKYKDTMNANGELLDDTGQGMEGLMPGISTKIKKI